jgi:hypothetical protein
LLPHAAALLFASLFAVRGTERARFTSVSRRLENAPSLAGGVVLVWLAVSRSSSPFRPLPCLAQSLSLSLPLQRHAVPLGRCRSSLARCLTQQPSFSFRSLPCVVQSASASQQSLVASRTLRPRGVSLKLWLAVSRSSSPLRSLPCLAQSQHRASLVARLNLSLPRERCAGPCGQRAVDHACRARVHITSQAALLTVCLAWHSACAPHLSPPLPRSVPRGRCRPGLARCLTTARLFALCRFWHRALVSHCLGNTMPSRSGGVALSWLPHAAALLSVRSLPCELATPQGCKS